MQLATANVGDYAVSYMYDANGIRTSKTVNGVKVSFYYDGNGQLIRSDDGTNKIDYLYDQSASPFGLKYNGTMYYYITNVQGDIIGILDQSGNKVVDYVYDSWGKLISITGSAKDTVGYRNALRYRGYYYDTESGFYLTGTRYYDPVIGRFINADGYISTGQGLGGTNMFSYCGNNPVNRADPTGLLWQEVVDFVVAAAKILSQVSAKAAASAAAAAAKSATGAITGGSVYRQLPNGLASALTAQSNTLSTVSSGASTLGKVAGAASLGITTVSASIKVYNNFSNDNLKLSRKISDSVVDVGVTVGSIWASGAIGASVGTAIPIPGVGTAVGFVAGVTIGLIVEHTPVVSWVKDGAGWIADKLGGLFGG